MVQAPAASFERSVATNTSIWLDVIRGIAAQVVLFSHTFQIFFSGDSLVTPTYSVLMAVALFAKQAVVSFFVISGWLVGGKLLRDLFVQKFELRKYIIDRTTRLWVVLIPALVLTMMCDQVAIRFGAGMTIIANRSPFYPEWWYQVFPWSLKTFLSNLFFLQMIASWQFGSNLSLWSLSNEFWYYLLFPCILGIFLSHRTKTRLICLIAAIGVIGLFFVSDRTPLYISYFLIWSAAGIAAQIPRKLATFVIVVAALSVPAIFTVTAGIKMPLTSDLFTATVALLFLLWSDKIPIRKLCRPAKFLSSYSYSVYAIHLPVLLVLMSFDPALFVRVDLSAETLIRFMIYMTFINLVALGFSRLTEEKTDWVRGIINTGWANFKTNAIQMRRWTLAYHLKLPRSFKQEKWLKGDAT